MFVDATKAFDSVNYTKLFRILKDVCPLECRYLADTYSNNIFSVKWKTKVTKSFEVTNGVKQGGVLSPVLFGLCLSTSAQCLIVS